MSSGVFCKSSSPIATPLDLTFTSRTRTCLPEPSTESMGILDFLRISSFSEPADLPFPNQDSYLSGVLRAPEGQPEYEPRLDLAREKVGLPLGVIHPSFSWRPKTTRMQPAELPSSMMGDGFNLGSRANVRYQNPRPAPIPSPTTVFQLFGDGLERLMYRAPSASLRTSETTGEPVLGDFPNFGRSRSRHIPFLTFPSCHRGELFCLSRSID
jgi:hypothetical protein